MAEYVKQWGELLATCDDEDVIHNVLHTPMCFVIDFTSRLRVIPAAQNIGTEPATGTLASPSIADGPSAEPWAAIFVPIMQSLERIEEYIDALPDKPTGSSQV